jgi:PKD repeat protein
MATKMLCKKVFVFFLIFVIISVYMTAIQISANAGAAGSEDTTLSIYPTNIIGPPPGIGQTFAVNVTIQNVANFFLYDFSVSWDPTVLNYSGPVTYFTNFFKGTFGQGMEIYSPGLIDGIASSYLSGSGATGSGPLVGIKFKVLDYGLTGINISVTTLLNSTGTAIPYSVVNGSFTLAGPMGPIAMETYTPTRPRANETVTFDASASKSGFNGTASVPIANYTWNFGDGTPKVTETSPITTHNYTASGTYTVKLTVTCQDDPVLIAKGLTTNSTTQRITILPQQYGPTAEFTYSPSVPFVNKTITFNASASMPGWNGTHDVAIANYTWNFGDLNITTATNSIITHVYNTTGTYTVKLTVTCQDDPVLIAKGLTTNSTTQRISITIPTPTVSMSPTSIIGPPPATGETFIVNITIQNVTDLALYYITVSWNPTVLNYVGNVTYLTSFFKGTFDQGLDEVYNQAGGYIAGIASSYLSGSGATGSGPLFQIEFRVIGTRPCGTWISISPILHDPEGENIKYSVVNGYFALLKAPVASLAYSPPSPSVGEPVAFNASASTPGNGSIVSYGWNFGDGNTTKIANPIIYHTYMAAGNYTVVLNVTNNQGFWNTTSENITVHPPFHDVGVLSVTPSPTEVTIGENVTITVVVKNNGSYTESFNVTAYYNTTTIGMQTVTNLAAGTNTSLTFTWDTAGVAAGSYTIKAVAPLAGDISPGDNVLTDGQVEVEEAPVGPSIPWLWVIVAVVIVIIAVSVVYMQMRRNRSSQ